MKREHEFTSNSTIKALETLKRMKKEIGAGNNKNF